LRVVSILLLVAPRPLEAAVLNMTNDTIAGIPQTSTTVGSTIIVGGWANGAFFRRPLDADESGSGSGIFRDLYRVDSNSGPEAGYNRDGVMDSSVPNGFDPVITMADLVEDSTGTSYVFVIDTNEPGSAAAQYVSLDDFKVYLGASIPPDPLPQSLSEMGQDLGVPVYDMRESGQDNHLLLDYSLYSGSGEMDLWVFIPKWLFGDASLDQQVYVYTEFGAWTGAPGFDPAAGPEQVSMPGKSVTGLVDPLIPFVPEPGVAALLLVSGVLSCRRRR
jgi:hypothetical protein